VPGKNHIECQAKHNEAYATPPVRPPHARRAGMSPPPRIIIQGAAKGLAKAVNQGRPRGFVNVQMQGVRAARDILRAQQAKQRQGGEDPLAFHVASPEAQGFRGLGSGIDMGTGHVLAGSPPILKPVQNQDKYIDDALQRRLQAQRRKRALGQGNAPPLLGFEGLSKEAVDGAAASVVAAAEKARLLREEAAASLEDEQEMFAMEGGGEDDEDDDDRPPFA
jgi:hypothetical protein